MDSELDKFKSEIDLRAYAATQGYELDRRDSSATSAVMRHQPSDDKIIIKKGTDGHWVYFSVRDDADNGTIIDFAKRRLGCSLGAVRKELRGFMGLPRSQLPTYPALPAAAKDRIRVERAYARTKTALRHPYLENERGIPGQLLGSRRFIGRIRIDSRGNAVFPHMDADGLSGFEMKNSEFTSFASGGHKSLWLSHAEDSDTRLLVCESAVDALSYAVLFPDEFSRYASIGGRPTPLQRELIRSAAAAMPASSTVVAAMDADAAGHELAEILREAVRLTGRSDLRFEVDVPEGGVKDWNDLLRRRPGAALPRRSDEPSVA